MKVTVVERYLDLEARSTAMEVAWRYFGSHLRPCHPSRRSQSHGESPVDLSSWWLSLRWAPVDSVAESSATSEDSRDSAATAATAATAVAAGTSTRVCSGPRRHSPARMPAFFCRPVDVPIHRFQKVCGEISLVILCKFVTVTWLSKTRVVQNLRLPNFTSQFYRGTNAWLQSSISN